MARFGMSKVASAYRLHRMVSRRFRGVSRRFHKWFCAGIAQVSRVSRPPVERADCTALSTEATRAHISQVPEKRSAQQHYTRCYTPCYTPIVCNTVCRRLHSV